ncbi:hypothetical protein FKP32DRAFT_1587942 [Trametes sanguinea]|nr:hypothetical protein FKP32DRAFT_1587942 [Trametes sanguinea]
MRYRKQLETLHDLSKEPGEREDPEAEMYGPMYMIFNVVEVWYDFYTGRPARRTWEFTGSWRSEKHRWEVLSLSADKPPFVLSAQHACPVIAPSDPPDNRAEDQSWIPNCAFMDILQPTEHNERSPSTWALAQAADHALYLFRHHPFQLYVFGILLCADRFWLGMFDREGIVLSAAHRIEWMSPQELGQDPTVSLAGRRWGAYPSFDVPIGRPTDAQDVQRWTTVGPAIWSSESVIGRGTALWNAMPHSAPGDSDSVAMLKQSWRAPNRRGEYETYTRIRRLLDAAGKSHAGLAHLLDGGDVYLPGSEMKLTVRNMRGEGLCDDEHPRQDPILYRVVVQEIGRPLWEYEDLEQLARAVKCAIEGHRTLCDVGVLHRDIGLASIMIRTKARLSLWKTDAAGTRIYDVQHEFPPSALTEGFLVGYEFASLPGHEDDPVPAFPEDASTGLPIFLASEVLMGVHCNTPVARTASHDLQSFLWVVLYLAYRRAVEEIPPVSESEDPELHEQLRAEYNGLFAAYSAAELLNSRAAFFVKSHVPELDASTAQQQCAGIQALLRSVQTHSPSGDAFRGLIEAIWIVLQKCQPLHYVPSSSSRYSEVLQGLDSSLEQNVSTSALAQNMVPQGPSSSVARWKSTAAALNLSHDILLDLFARFLQDLSEDERR